jgi:hypothetical protein
MVEPGENAEFPKETFKKFGVPRVAKELHRYKAIGRLGAGHIHIPHAASFEAADQLKSGRGRWEARRGATNNVGDRCQGEGAVFGSAAQTEWVGFG